MGRTNTVPIERLEQVEQRLNVELRGMTAQETSDDIWNAVFVYGEVFATNADENYHLRVVASVYSAKEEVIGQGSTKVFLHRLVGFDPFGIDAHCSRGHGKAARVRVYVTLRE